MLLEDFFEHIQQYDDHSYDEQIKMLAEEVDIITQEDSDLVVAARNLIKAQKEFDDLYCAAEKKLI